MGIIDRFFRRRKLEARKKLTSWDFLAGPGSYALTGFTGPEKALAELAVAHRCTQLIAETLASVPLHLFATRDGARERATDHPLYRVLHDEPSDRQTAFEFREAMLRSVLMWGNAVAEIVRNGRGQTIGLVPIAWGNVAVEKLASGRLRYRVSGGGDPTRVLLDEDVLHVRYASRDGIIGQSPLELTGSAVGLAIQQAQTARQMAERALVPLGGFMMPKEQTEPLPDPVFKRLKEQLHALMLAHADTGRPLVLEQGMQFQPFSTTASDAQFIEARRLGLQDIARVYGVPASVVGLSDRPTYGSVEQEHRALVSQCLAPWAKRLESALERALLSAEARRTYVIEHDLAGLLRGDLTARYAAYAVGITNGFMSANEARRIENMPPRDGGDEFLTPMNMHVGAPAVD